MKNNFNDFTGLSPVQKTICMELVPSTITKKHISITGNDNDIFHNDFMRNEKYNDIKKVMDDFYRDFISKNLTRVPDIDWNILFDLYAQKADKKIIDEKETELAALIMDSFDPVDKKAVIFSAKFISTILPEFIQSNNGYTEEDKGCYLTAAKAYSRFNGGLKKYFDAKPAMFDKIGKRIASENAAIFYENMVIAKKFFEKVSLTEFVNEFNNRLSSKPSSDKYGCKPFTEDEITRYFSLEKYKDCYTQDGIMQQNDFYGRMNHEINLYCQAHGIKNEYKFRSLYKQILSEEKSLYEVPATFSADKEVYDAVNDFLALMRENKVLDRLEIVASDSREMNLSEIYVSYKNFAEASTMIYGRHSAISDALYKDFDNSISGKKDSKSREVKVKRAVKDVKILSLEEINNLIDSWGTDRDRQRSSVLCIEKIEKLISQADDSEMKLPPESDKIQEKRELAHELKTVLDGFLHIYQWCKLFQSDELKNMDKELMFYADVDFIYDLMNPIVDLYNKVRNYSTKEPFIKDKMKLNFNCPTLLNGWSENKLFTNNAFFMMRDGKYYLGILNPNNKPGKDALQGHADDKPGDYKRLVFDSFNNAYMMLPKCFISSKTYTDEHNTDACILDGYKAKKHVKGNNNSSFDLEFCHKLIDYFKNCISAKEEWQIYDFKFSETSSYNDISEFYQEVDAQSSHIGWTYVSKDAINEMDSKGQIFLFQIYNKDFSKNAHGSKDIFTLYLENLFSEENLKNPVLSLQGGAEIFLRKKSIEKPIVHKAGSYIVNKTYVDADGATKTMPNAVYTEIYKYLNKMSKKPLSQQAQAFMSKASYKKADHDIVKDRRYTVDKYLLHFPVQINPLAAGVNINDKVNEYISNNAKDMHVIGINRGVRNLIYVSVIDAKGRIVEQKSLNILNGTDYADKLKIREGERIENRKDWDSIKSIKNLKNGYLSIAINEIAKLVIKYNAVIAMEDLDNSFKQKSVAIEKQVYQQFENALFAKLNYLVFKNNDVTENGGILKGYQLAYIPDSKAKMGRQNGIIFLMSPVYTKALDPITGFLNIFKMTDLDSFVKTDRFIEQFDSIAYDKNHDMFRFDFDYNNFEHHNIDLKKTCWSVYTHGTRLVKSKKNGVYQTPDEISVTKQMKETLSGAGIDWQDCHDLRREILEIGLSKIIIDIFKLTLQYNNDGEYISSTMDNSGNFFDTRKISVKTYVLPENVDANAAYGIATKGLVRMNHIAQGYDPTAKKHLPDDCFKMDINEWIETAIINEK